MRITFVMPAGRVSGGARVVAIYAGRLAARGHDVHVLWHRLAPRPWPQRLRARLKGHRRERKTESPYFDGLGVTQSVAARPGAIGDADVRDGDVVVATWWNTAFEVAALSPAKGAGVYFVQHHEVHGHLPVHLARGSYYLPLKKITIAGWLVETMAREYGDHDVALVPNAVDMDLFQASPRAKNATPTVGFMYSETAFKGIDVTTRAIALARERVPELRVMAFGKKAASPHLPLPEGTEYFRDPSQAKLREIYAACDGWLMGSRSEGFGLPLLEAMACRTPVISTRTGAAPDLIRDGAEGWVVDVDDAAAMAARLVELAALPPAKWAAMSEAAHARATSHGWDDATDRFEAALKRVAGTSLDRDGG